jgi:anaerobic ribonucleoside-triphosphate reductase
MVNIIKKNGDIQKFNGEKIKRAIRKSASRVCVTLSDKDEKQVVDSVKKQLQYQETDIKVDTIHNMVEVALDHVNSDVARSYREYRDNKNQFASMLDKVYSKKLSLNFIGDRSNANSDSALVTTQKAIVYNELNSELYKKFFLTQKEERAVSDGYIYIHDRGSRLDTINCCIYDMKNLITGGFFMGNLDYQEPKSLEVAFDLIGDVTLNAASSQYGGFTIPQVDKLFAPYAEKSYKKYYNEFLEIACEAEESVNKICSEKDYTLILRWNDELSNYYTHVGDYGILNADIDEFYKKADEYATNKVRRDFEQGFQSWEMKFNSVASSRGDYPFTAITFGLGTGKFETMCSSVCMKVRADGQGNEGHKHPVLFPKLSFFYDENLHGEGKELEWLFDEALNCSMKTMYPDFISLSGDGYAPRMYKKYGVAISRMGCVDKNSKITIKIDNKIETLSFDDVWNKLVDKTLSDSITKHINNDDKHFTEYIDLDGVEILDRDGFVKCNRILKNHNENNWVCIKITTIEGDEKELICTHDHPITLSNGTTKQASELINDDIVITFKEQGRTEPFFSTVKSIEMIDMVDDSFDVTTESEHFSVNGIWSHNCRAQTSPWFERGGMEPADENDKPVYDGRFNMGAISLHFSMIAAKAKKEDKDFFEVLEYYLDMVRGIHKRTVEFLSHKKAGINPLGFCQGGFYHGNKDPDEELGLEFLKPMTISFGIIGLNEASVFVTGKPIHEDNTWAIKVLKFINDYADKYKKIDGILYAIYGTPGESLVATQAMQMKKKYGIIKGVSDKDYVTNSFHCHVSADITPIQKQDIEYPMFHLCNGGNIGYARMRSNYNFKAFKDITKRAMKMGFYWGNNQQLDWCEDCGFAFSDSDVCPKCGSEHITRIERMNGYLSYSSIRGKTMYSDTKLAEFKDRKSM